ncbi:hypothetical protein ACPCAJ_24360 [Streptomyces griseoincarnatus]
MIEHLRDKGPGVGFACRVLGLSESAYYARKKRPKSARRLRAVRRSVWSRFHQAQVTTRVRFWNSF